MGRNAIEWKTGNQKTVCFPTSPNWYFCTNLQNWKHENHNFLTIMLCSTLQDFNQSLLDFFNLVDSQFMLISAAVHHSNYWTWLLPGITRQRAGDLRSADKICLHHVNCRFNMSTQHFTVRRHLTHEYKTADIINDVPHLWRTLLMRFVVLDSSAIFVVYQEYQQNNMICNYCNRN